jgi:hypothetical protein
MFLSLIVAPVVYGLFDRGMERLGWNKRQKIELEP